MFEGLVPMSLAGGLAISAVLFVVALSTVVRRFVSSYKEKVLESTSIKLSDMFIFVDARTLTKVSLVATVVGALLLLALTLNPLVAATGAILCLFGPRLAHARLNAQRRNRLIRQLPDTLDALVGALRSGMSLQQGLGLLAEQLPAPSNQEFSFLVRKLRIGVGVDEALEELERRIESLEYTLFTTSIRIAREVGGNLTEALERLAETMRKKIAMEDKIVAMTAQGKLQGLIVGCLPLFLMLVLNEMEPEAMAPLFNTMLGYGVMLVIVVLELVGFILIRKIVRIDV